MSRNDGSMFWITNKEWWQLNEAGEFHLTDKAPEEVTRSFEIWVKANNMKDILVSKEVIVDE